VAACRLFEKWKAGSLVIRSILPKAESPTNLSAFLGFSRRLQVKRRGIRFDPQHGIRSSPVLSLFYLIFVLYEHGISKIAPNRRNFGSSRYVVTK